MHWNDRIFTGSHGKWSWLIVRDIIPNLARLVANAHIGQRLCITAFDSGPLSPSPEEETLGWTSYADIMVSPPLTADIRIPCGEFDEWYVFPSPPKSLAVTDRYVNYMDFNLADPTMLAASYDPTWDQSGLDWLVPLQEKFWSEINRLAPSSYIASGDCEIIATSMPSFAKLMLDVARGIVDN